MSSRVAQVADGVIVGSALVSKIEDPAHAVDAARDFVAKLYQNVPLNFESFNRELGAFVTLTAGGTPQTTVAGTAFPTPLQVTVTQGGSPVAGVTVSFSLPSSGASATLSAASAVTNASGVASVMATANSSLGNYTVTATTGGLTASFLLTNALGAPARNRRPLPAGS